MGRTEGNDLVLPSGLVSRQHARLNIQGTQIWLLDLHSSNGTLLNGQRIPPNQWVALTPGPYFQVGEFYLCLELAAPAPASPAANVAAAPTQIRVPPPPALAPVTALSQPPSWTPQASRGRSHAQPWLIGGGILVLLAIVLATIYFLAQRGAPPAIPGATQAVQATQPPQATLTPADTPAKVLSSASLQPGNALVKDGNGISASLAAGVMPEGQSASVITTQLGGEVTRRLGAGYQVDTPAYSLSAGSSDAQAGATLSFPAKSDTARLAVLIDGKYLGVLDNPPQNGQLTVDASIASSDFNIPNYPALVKGEPAQYFVVSPKKGSAQPAPGQTAGILSVNYHLADPDGQTCVAEFWTATHCWRNNEKSIYVFWQDDFPAELKDREYLKVVDTIRTIQQVMAAYVSKGITSAALSSDRPIYVIIQADLKEPNYRPQLKRIYLDWGFVAKAGGATPECTIAHEVMHLVENRKYWMIPDYYSNAKAWWLDMAAEMGSFMLNSACVDHNLTFYGKVEANGGGLGFQASPFTWDGGEQARYIQAQQVWISTCSGGATCALTEEGFAQAIADGTFPLNGGAAQEAYYKNAKDLGLYLLGAAPQASRTSVEIPKSASNGRGYGDYLVLKGGDNAGFEFGLTASQFNRKSPTEVVASATIQKGGVYPLWVGNGKGTPLVPVDQPGLPGVLKIEAGAPYWLSLDGAAPKFYDGSKELTVAPLSATLGKGLARIVAVAPDANQTFKASLKVADFSGDWSANISNQQISATDCKGYDSSEAPKPAADDFLKIFSGLGTYQVDPTVADGSHLIWQGSLPQGLIGESEIWIKPDSLVLTYLLDQPKSTSLNLPMGLPPVAAASSPQAAASLALGLPALPALALLAKRRKRAWQRILLLAALFACLAVLLSGCFGLGIFGKLDATYTFKKVEYVDPQTAPGGKSDVTWKLTDGSAKIDIDYTIEATTTDANGNDTTETSKCLLTVTARATGTIGPEGSVPAPQMSSSK